MLVTDDNLRAIEALKKNNYRNAEEKEVVIIELEDTPGALKRVTGKLAGAGIDINHIYGTTCPGKCPARLVLATSDNEKALLVFKE